MKMRIKKKKIKEWLENKIYEKDLTSKKEKNNQRAKEILMERYKNEFWETFEKIPHRNNTKIQEC